MTVSTIIAVLFLLLAPTEGPTYNPYMKAAGILEGQTFKVSERFDDFDGFFELADIIIRENREPCG